jgi:hypothetical protein
MGAPSKGKSEAIQASRRDPSPASLSSPLLDPEDFLLQSLDQLERAREELVEARSVSDSAGGMSFPPGTSTEDIEKFKADCQRAVRQAFARYQESVNITRKAEADVRRRKLEAPLQGSWAGEHVRLRTELQEQYSGLGPQYDLLCDNAAATAIMLRQLETSGGDFDMDTWKTLHELHLKYLAQLQRYTEAMKSESINRQTQEIVVEVVRVFETHFGNAYPEVWKRATGELKLLVDGAA